MALNKYKIGELIELFDEKCNIPNLTVMDVSGINRDKEFFEPSKQVGADTSNYKLVPPTYFACNLMHVGRDVVLPVALNHTEKNKIVSPAYSVFKLKNEAIVLRDFLFILLKSTEKDRYFWFHADASVRDGMSWDDLCSIEIELPPLPIQQKYVNIYKSMVANQQSYERGLDDLKLVCDGYIEDLRRKIPCEEIGQYIEVSEDKNENLKYGIDDVRGISNDKKLIYTKANMKDVNLAPYYLIKPNEFAYVTVTSRNGGKISLTINDTDKTYICSSSYIVFRTTDKTVLLPQYLMLFLSRSEFNRYSRFNSWGSARETFDWSEMCSVKLPIPDINTQKAIADIYKVYCERIKINEKLKAQIKDICPILIKGSIDEARKA